ncbi:hypothetical protein BDN72DRAFT_642039 [Pluteus cervinus]|uniref:Uncharacterized protein n=1 Tax=Pluteus cervinus TaxID=181527 RepID=A0ACD3A0F2_9AGAR|nr:hypothetical protein BDN72DRAFT_642039 [Pluteus cervinus]
MFQSTQEARKPLGVSPECSCLCHGGLVLGVLGGEEDVKAKAIESQQVGGEFRRCFQSICRPRKPPEIDSRGPSTRWAVWGVVCPWWGGGPKSEGHREPRSGPRVPPLLPIDSSTSKTPRDGL